MEAVDTYRDGEDFVNYIITETGHVCMGAHTYKHDKYPYKMLKAMVKTFLKFGEVYTILPYDYIVEFFGKHCTLELIDSERNLYKVTKDG